MILVGLLRDCRQRPKEDGIAPSYELCVDSGILGHGLSVSYQI